MLQWRGETGDQLKLFLLGSFRAERNDGTTPQLRRKTRAFAAYLAATARSHPRHHLIELFCAEANNPAAVFRTLMSRARKQLGADAIQVEGDQIRLNPRIWVDSVQFASSVQKKSSTAQLITRLSLYQGDFLANLTLANAPEFELWVLGERARYRSLYEREALTLVEELSGTGRFGEAIDEAQKLVASNPLLETAHGRLIWLYAQTGRLDAAHAQYQQISDLLASELAVEPTPELQRLYEDIQSGKIRPQSISSSPTPDAPIPPSALIGRERELSHLHQAWQTAKHERGSVIIIEAEAGGGKTHLLNSFGQTIETGSMLFGEGYESAQAIPYGPWLDLLERLLAQKTSKQIAEFSGVVRASLAQLVPGRLSLSSTQGLDLPTERLFAALGTLLLEQPRCLVIDNLQWADPTSVQLFHYLARRVSRAPVLLVGVTRPAGGNESLSTLLDDLHRQDAVHLSLPPLSEENVIDLLEEQWPRLPVGFRPHVAGMLHQATRGNPLFLTEIIRELAPTEAVPEALPVPPSVRDLIQRRLRRLPAAAQQVVETLAILHAPAAPELLQQISGRSEEETILAFDLALKKGLIDPHEGDQYDFHHDLMREAIVQQLTPLRRRLLHKRTAVTLLPTGRPAILAYHWHHAGDLNQEAHYAALAGTEAYAVYANDDAERYLKRSLELAPRGETWLHLGNLYHRTGAWGEAEDAYRRAAQEALNDDERATAHFALGKLGMDRGRTDDALRLLGMARDHLQHRPPSQTLSETLSKMAAVHMRISAYDLALQELEESLAIAEALRDQPTVANRIGNIGVVYLTMGDLEKAQTHLEEALRRSRKLDMPELVANWLGVLGTLYAYRTEPEEALRRYHEAKAIDESLGNQAGILRHTGNLGLEYHALGDEVNALRYLLEAWQMGSEMGSDRIVAIVVGNVGLILQDTGDFEGAERCHLWSLQVDLQAQEAEGIARHLANLGQIAQRRERIPLAIRCYRLSIALFQFSQHPYYLAHIWHRLAEIHWDRGEVSAALEYLDQAQEIASEREQFDYLSVVFALKTQVLLSEGTLPLSEGLATLEKWLARDEVPALEKAYLAYKRWQITQTTADRRAAADRYRDLHTQKAHWLFRQRYRSLTGELLPDPALPPLPVDFPAAEIPNLDDLMIEVERFLASRSS